MSENNIPVFVKVEEYKDVIDIMKVLKEKVKEANVILGDINKLKNEEDAELELWSKNLTDVNSKLEFIDKLLFEPKF
ncbi:hypothetical protein C0585_06345 [Candidatus Woesearchaeota archaeon]|nr:MAG: hypothetical protein C0585_06345 [Candidatus Woesearchaeota archaeon]